MQLEHRGDVIPLSTGGDVIPLRESWASPCWEPAKLNFYCSKGHKLAYLFIFNVKFSAVQGIFV